MTLAAEAFDRDGCSRLPGVLGLGERQRLTAELATLPSGAAGQRDLLDQPWCRALAVWLKTLPGLGLLSDLAAVQCTLFEKSSARNWLVSLHQDLAIPVAEPVAHPGLRGWSVKEGRHFVLAPAELLGRLVAVRVHLDDATSADGGLRFVPASHRHGVLDDDAIRQCRDRNGEQPADALAGDILLMHPLVLHASSKGCGAGRRRVLHFLFGPRELPFGLHWHTAA